MQWGQKHRSGIHISLIESGLYPLHDGLFHLKVGNTQIEAINHVLEVKESLLLRITPNVLFHSLLNGTHLLLIYLVDYSFVVIYKQEHLSVAQYLL